MIYLKSLLSLTVIIVSIHSSQVWEVQEESQTVPIFCLLPSAVQKQLQVVQRLQS